MAVHWSENAVKCDQADARGDFLSFNVTKRSRAAQSPARQRAKE